jgi:hypothetical protein
LKAKVVDVYGDEKSLAGIELRSGGGNSPTAQYGTLAYDVFPEDSLGQFRIEALAERDEKRISPVNELVMTRIRRPRYWDKDAPDSPFGDHFLSNARTVASMKAAGINWERLNDNGMKAAC